jgi:hypothetical protein
VELAECGVALADRGVEARRHAGEVANRHHLVERQLGLRRDLLVGGLAVEPSRQLGRDTVDRALALRDVGGDPDRPTAVVEPALDRLLDPQHRVGGELVAAPPVVLLGRPDQSEHRLLDEVAQVEPMALVAARELDHEPEVRVDHALLGGEVAALDPLRELDLLLRGQKRILHRLVDEQLEAVRGGLGHAVAGRPALRRGLLRRLLVMLTAGAMSVAALGRSASCSRHRAPCFRGLRPSPA